MFTGIVEGVYPITAAADRAGGRRLTVDLAGGPDRPVSLGDSIAVDGVCLTAAAAEGTRVSFDVIAQTLGRTTLRRRRVGDRVNVERALRAGDELGGHFVQGHVDGTADLLDRREGGGQTVLRFRPADARLIGQMIAQGSVAVDGASLTLAEVDRAGGTFAVALIPTTLARTTLGFRRVGEPVNVETDLVGKWIARWLADLGAAPGGGLTMDKLRESGFA